MTGMLSPVDRLVNGVDVMKFAWVVVVFLVVACTGVAASTGPDASTGADASTGPIKLLTTEMPCYTAELDGMLVADARYGTVLVEDGGTPEAPSDPVPVAWRPGFTARQVGSEVEVLDQGGHVVNTTGRQVKLPGGFGSVDGIFVWLNCNLGTP
jgi:hypothetical protein